MQTRLSSCQFARASLKRQAVRFNNSLTNSNFTYRCERAQFIIWGYFLLASLGTEKAENMRRSHVAKSVADYATFKSDVITLFEKFEFKGSYSAMLRTHNQVVAESIAAYAASTTDGCLKAYAGFSTKTQLSFAENHFILGLADSTSHDYLLHDRASRPLTRQEVVRMAQACKALQFSLHAPSNAAAVASTHVGASSLDDCTCAPAESTDPPAWQQKSARDERVRAGALFSCKEDSRTYASASRPSKPQQSFCSLGCTQLVSAVFEVNNCRKFS